jgi:hypothetical protein
MYCAYIESIARRAVREGHAGVTLSDSACVAARWSGGDHCAPQKKPQ